MPDEFFNTPEYREIIDKNYTGKKIKDMDQSDLRAFRYKVMKANKIKAYTMEDYNA